MANAEKEKTIPKKLVIRSWPKMIFLWPSGVLCLIIGLLEMFLPDWSQWLGRAFVLCFALNMIVITFDFPRVTSLTVAFAIIAAVVSMILINQYFEIIPPLAGWIQSLDIQATKEFYFAMFAAVVVLYIGMFVVTRFDYWELTANELVHHHGILGDVERHTTAGLKLNKELSDLFEWVLAGSGTLILTVPGVSRPVVLENVPGINMTMRKADYILNARYVRVETSGGSREDAEEVARRQRAEELEP